MSDKCDIHRSVPMRAMQAAAEVRRMHERERASPKLLPSELKSTIVLRARWAEIMAVYKDESLVSCQYKASCLRHQQLLDDLDHLSSGAGLGVGHGGGAGAGQPRTK